MNILQGLRAVALASGFKRGEFIGDTKLSPTIIRYHHHHRVAHEKIGRPHIILYQISTVYSVSIHKFIPAIRFCFQSYPEKAKKKNLGFLVSAIA
jgi:hypothetical protein